MARSFQQSQDAYKRGDGALAKDLSNQGKDHRRRMESLNKQASDWIFQRESASFAFSDYGNLMIEWGRKQQGGPFFFVFGELKLISGSKDRSPREIDLHGLYVKEAIAHTDAAIQTAKKRGESDLHLIVGPSGPQLPC